MPRAQSVHVQEQMMPAARALRSGLGQRSTHVPPEGTLVHNTHCVKCSSHTASVSRAARVRARMDRRSAHRCHQNPTRVVASSGPGVACVLCLGAAQELHETQQYQRQHQAIKAKSAKQQAKAVQEELDAGVGSQSASLMCGACAWACRVELGVALRHEQSDSSLASPPRACAPNLGSCAAKLEVERVRALNVSRRSRVERLSVLLSSARVENLTNQLPTLLRYQSLTLRLAPVGRALRRASSALVQGPSTRVHAVRAGIV